MSCGKGIRVLSQALMETEVAGLIGAERHERTRRAHGATAMATGCGRGTRGWARSSWRSRRSRPGRTFPSLLQPRRRAEHALLAVVQEAYVHGVSTRKVDELMKALGARRRLEVGGVADLRRARSRWWRRFGRGRSPASIRYLWVDATYHKVRVDGRVTSQATVVAVGVTSEGERQVLGIDVGPSEDRAFWTAFLRSLVKRGLKGVRLISE